MYVYDERSGNTLTHLKLKPLHLRYIAPLSTFRASIGLTGIIPYR